jgi:hypothetical protein
MSEIEESRDLFGRLFDRLQKGEQLERVLDKCQDAINDSGLDAAFVKSFVATLVSNRFDVQATAGSMKIDPATLDLLIQLMIVLLPIILSLFG